MKDNRWHTMDEIPERCGNRVCTKVLCYQKYHDGLQLDPYPTMKIAEYQHEKWDLFPNRKVGWHDTDIMWDSILTTGSKDNRWHYLPDVDYESEDDCNA